jgi:hypothetical protein
LSKEKKNGKAKIYKLQRNSRSKKRGKVQSFKVFKKRKQKFTSNSVIQVLNQFTFFFYQPSWGTLGEQKFQKKRTKIGKHKCIERPNFVTQLVGTKRKGEKIKNLQKTSKHKLVRKFRVLVFKSTSL